MRTMPIAARTASLHGNTQNATDVTSSDLFCEPYVMSTEAVYRPSAKLRYSFVTSAQKPPDGLSIVFAQTA